jgi:iron complex outermembrane receptor protein
MNTVRTPLATARRRLAIICLCTVGLAVVFTGGVARAQDAPLAAWRQTLAEVESGLRSVKPDDAMGRGALGRQLEQLRGEITSWLASYPAARGDVQPWIEPAPSSTTRLEDLAAEIGRLRAAIARIANSLQQGGESGAFYLGRVDVAVTAEVAVVTTTEMAPAGASLIEARDIRVYDRMALSEGLSLAPGVSFSRIGQRNETTVYVRGFDIRQVPVFIDGIPIYTPYDGYADLERFTTFDVAELRVSKGFSSVLYGPNALGGAINIVSRRPTKRVEGNGGVGIASGPSRNVFLNLGSRFHSWYAQGGASYLQADTFPLSSSFVPVKNEDGGSRDNAYRRDAKFNVKLAYTPNGTDEYAISYVGQRGKKGNPPYAGSDSAVKVRYWQWPFWNKDSVYFVSNTSLGSAGYLRGRAYYDTYDNALYSYDDNTYTTQAKSSSFQSLYHDYTIGGSAEWGATLGSRQTLRAAFHAKQDNHRENNVGAPVTRDQGLIVSLGVEDTIAFSPTLSVVAGLSGDRQTTSLAETLVKNQVVDLALGTTSGINPQVGLFYSLRGTGMVRATVSHKTRLPSLKDRYSFKFGTAIPNPDLKPERATTVETGYQGALGAKASFQASVFYSYINDLIQRFYVRPNLSQQQNIGRASYAGFEADVRSRMWRRVEIWFNYTYLNRRNLSDPATPLVDTPRHKGLASVAADPVRPLRLMGYVDFEAGRQTLNEAGHLYEVGSIATLGAKATWTIRPQVEVELGLTNITNRNYWLAEGYPEAGRTVLSNVRARF